MIIILLTGLLLIITGCARTPYKVCGTSGCSAPMTQEQAVNAAEVQKAWDGDLYIDIVKER